MTAFADAASLLAGTALEPERDAAARTLLARLKGDDTGSAPPDRNLTALLAVADRMPRLFELASPLAPGLAFVGGSVDLGAFGAADARVRIVDVAGRGVDFRGAWHSCIGEAVESLSLARSGAMSGASAGCAAGETPAAAALAAVLELVERDAAALWWIGGRMPRTLPLEALADTGIALLLDRLRQGSRMRRTWLLDLTTDLDIPCVAALSDNPTGSGFACGLGACTSVGGAARSALLELCQMELAAALVAAKVRESGVQALSPTERRTWLLSQSKARDCSAVMGTGPGDQNRFDPRLDPTERLDWLLKQLLLHGLECSFADLTQEDLAVPCMRASVPGLQPLSADTQTPRLAAILSTGGRGPLYTEGLELL